VDAVVVIKVQRRKRRKNNLFEITKKGRNLIWFAI